MGKKNEGRDRKRERKKSYVWKLSNDRKQQERKVTAFKKH